MFLKKVTLTFQSNLTNELIGFYKLAVRIARYKKYFKNIVFYPEIGENGNFHFHGIIEYTKINEVKYRSFIGNWRRYVGITKISDPNNKFASKDPLHKIQWLGYCQKDQAQWSFKRIHKYNYKQYIRDYKDYSAVICDRCRCPKHKPYTETRSILDWC